MVPAVAKPRRAQVGRSSERLSYAVFAGQLNTVFRVRLASGGWVRLKLIQARLAPPFRGCAGCPEAANAGQERFSLLFSGPPEAALASALYAFEHAQLGRFDMYIGEIGMRDTARVRYEAVFNQPGATPVGPRV